MRTKGSRPRRTAGPPEYRAGRGDKAAIWRFRQIETGNGILVEVNLGRDDQVQPGDFLTVFRDSPAAGQPRQVLGEIGILTTENRTSTAKILAMRRSMIIGDLVERR